MTEEITILKIGTSEAVKSVNDLKENIKILKDTLGGLDVGSKEYQETLSTLKVNQNALKDAMYATSSTMEDVSKAARGQSETYNSLVHRMAKLKEEFRATGDAARRMELGQQIKGINGQLKELDALQGNFQRNVGNYPKIQAAFKATAGAAGQMIAPITGITTGLKAMSATPVISILGLLANIITKVTASMSKSEAATNALNSALAGLQPVMDAINKILQGIGTGVVWVVDKFAKLTAAITGTTEAMKERQRIAAAEAEDLKQQREIIMQNADDELEIAKLREQATDKLNYTASQRLEFEKKAGELENQIAQRAFEDLKNQYELIKAKNALSASTAEELQKEADAYAAMVKAQTDYYNKVATNNKKLTTLRREEAKDAKDAAKEAQDALKAQVKAQIDLIQQEIDLTQKGTEQELILRRQKRDMEYKLDVEEAKTKVKNKTELNRTLTLLEKKYLRDLQTLHREHQKAIENQENLHLQNIADQYAQGTKEYLSAMKDLRLQQLEQIMQEEGETIEEYNARKLAAQKAYNDAVRALNERNLKDSTAELRLAIAKEMGETEAFLAGQMQLAQANYDHLRKLEEETETEFEIRRADAYKALHDAQKKYFDYQDEQERLHLENRMNSYQEGSMEYLRAAIELKKFELDTLAKMDAESDEAFYSRKLQAEKAYLESKKALAQQQIQIMSSVASATSSILSSIADMYESDSEESERNANKIKALRIASATIDTISGAIGAYMQSVATIPPPAGQIVGAVQAAAVTAAGLAQIAQIRNTQVKASAGDAGGVAAAIPAIQSAPSTSVDIPQVRSVTSASEEDRLNRMASDQRVYILSSDIEASQRSRRTQVAETSF